MNDKSLPAVVPRLPGENGLPLLPKLFDLHEVNMLDICFNFGELFIERDGDAEMNRRFGAGNFSSVILLFTKFDSFFLPGTDGEGKL